jgi:hypothetical protein
MIMFRRAVKEAADQQLAKRSKIDTGEAAVWLEDLRAMAAQDRADVRRAKAQHFGIDDEAEDMGDLIVCDNYSRSRSNPWAMVAGAGLIAAALVAGGWIVRSATKPEADQQPAAEDVDTQYEIGVGTFQPGD